MISFSKIAQLVLARLDHRVVRRGDEWITRCPFHDDHHPSFSFNFRKAVWFCHAGCGGGGLVQFIARCDGISDADAKAFLRSVRRADA